VFLPEAIRSIHSMNWGAYFLLAVIAGCWAAFLLGLDEVPGWQGFGKGLIVGSGAAVAALALNLFNWWRAKQAPNSN
jgi:hypothetical protein